MVLQRAFSLVYSESKQYTAYYTSKHTYIICPPLVYSVLRSKKKYISQKFPSAILAENFETNPSMRMYEGSY